LHLIMFDVDGTLVDSVQFDAECYLNAAQTVLGVKISSDWEGYKHATDTGILYEVIDRYKIPGQKSKILQEFRNVFVGLITESIVKNPGGVREIEGASRFIRYLRSQKNVRVAFATGCLAETARLKLEAAGIDVDGCAFASASDHPSRTEIITIAESRAAPEVPLDSRTYFGDASWDKKASQSLGYDFILVGNRIENERRILDFEDMESVLDLLNL
jgi:phosphoglycolate phosphatase-like HAD superfamily hydrolase